MKLICKKFLLNILVLMVVMLPLRSGFALSMESSEKDCMDGVEAEVTTMMSHDGHDMSASVQTVSQQEESVCVCCPQCDAQCAGCVHISAAITFDLLLLSDAGTAEPVSVTPRSLSTQTVTPPARPPQTL
ncbi:MAG: hypothetical protein RQ936_11695 [Gammaproteobacteria bacterium]|nr:hypothetical protein [Gammaproteobacteria bacterium]